MTKSSMHAVAAMWQTYLHSYICFTHSQSFAFIQEVSHLQALAPQRIADLVTVGALHVNSSC